MKRSLVVMAGLAVMLADVIFVDTGPEARSSARQVAPPYTSPAQYYSGVSGLLGFSQEEIRGNHSTLLSLHYLSRSRRLTYGFK